MIYRDFDVWISEAVSGAPYVWAQSDNYKTAQQPLSIPAGLTDEVAQLVRGAGDQSLVERVGIQLHAALFHDDIGTALVNLIASLDDNEGLRIRLRFDNSASSISVLPWEYLHELGASHPLAADVRTPVVRYVSVAHEQRDLEARLPIRVLVALPDAMGLDVALERRRIEFALAHMQDSVKPTVLEGGVTRTALSRALESDRYDVIHFMGHGHFSDGQGFLVIDGERGARDPVSEGTFAGFFLASRSVKLVVLNACEGAKHQPSRDALSGLAPRLVALGVPAVIAHQSAIADDAAILFAEKLYEALCSRGSVGQIDAALSMARRHLWLSRGDHTFGTPVLFTLASSGLLFSLPPAPESGPAEEEAQLRKLLRIHVENRRKAEQRALAESQEIAFIEEKLEALRSEDQSAFGRP